jgi:hypothetical protein
MTLEVYWIRAEHHSNMMLDGYIGVSKNAKNRWQYGHLWSHKNGRHDNPKFSNAIAKHGWDNLIKEILVIGEEKYCYELELKLRPNTEIGWNLAIGGGKPPVSTYRGDDYVSPVKGVPRPTPWMVGRTPANFGIPISDHTRAKLSAAHTGVKHTPEHVEKRMASRRVTRIARGQIRPFIINGARYESSKIASQAVNIPESTLKYWAYNKGNPSKAYAHITECRWL